MAKQSLIFRDSAAQVPKLAVRVGLKFVRRCETYVLAEVAEDRVALICTDDGNRWVDSVPVKDTTWLSQHEWFCVTGECPDEFVPGHSC